MSTQGKDNDELSDLREMNNESGDQTQVLATAQGSASAGGTKRIERIPRNDEQRQKVIKKVGCSTSEITSAIQKNAVCADYGACRSPARSCVIESTSGND